MERSISPQSVMTEATEFFDAEDREHDHSYDEDGRNITPTPNDQDIHDMQQGIVGQTLTSEAVSQLQAGFQEPTEGSYDAYMAPLQAAIDAAKSTSQSEMTEVDLNDTQDSTVLNSSVVSAHLPVSVQHSTQLNSPSSVSAASQATQPAIPSSPVLSLPRPPQSPSPAQSRPRKGPFLTYLDSLSAWTGSTMLRAEQSIRERFNGRVVPDEDQDIESKHSELTAAQASYRELIRLITLMATHYKHLVKLNNQLQQHTSQIAVRRPSIHGPAQAVADGFQTLHKCSAYLLGCLDFFLDSMNTLIDAAFQDAEDSYETFIQARLVRDAYLRQQKLVASQKTPKREAERKAKHDRLQETVVASKRTYLAKAELLHMHEIKMVEKQLTLLASAMQASVGGDRARLEDVLNESTTVIQAIKRHEEEPQGRFETMLDGVHSLLAGSLAPETGEL